MWNKKLSLWLSVTVCFLCTIWLTVGLFAGPWAAQVWFTVFRGFSPDGEALARMIALFKWCFYPCAVFAYITLYSLLRLLFNIKKDDVFVVANAVYLRRISWCCLAVAAITFIGGLWYLPFLFVAFAAAFVGLLLRVVKNVMQSAAEIKAENELTI